VYQKQRRVLIPALEDYGETHEDHWRTTVEPTKTTVSDVSPRAVADAIERKDREIRDAALRALMCDPVIRSASINVNVREGHVTLRGGVDHHYEFAAALDDVAHLRGVVGVSNELTMNAR
jgi:osmotically-inducible protein OsmY